MKPPSVIVVGTDTDAGKTAFSLHWMQSFPDYAYWKPVETGASDTKRVRALVPSARLHAPLLYLAEAVAPALAARHAGVAMPGAAQILAARPPGSLLIETFGSALSPLDDDTLQVEWLQKTAPGDVFILIASSTVGAIGRTLQGLTALAVYGIIPRAVVLIGPADAYAMAEIQKRMRVGNAHARLSVNVSADVQSADVQSAGVQSAGVQSADAPGLVGPSPTQVFTLPLVADSMPAPDLATMHAIAAALVAAAPETTLVARDRKSVWHPYTSLQPVDAPLPVREAYGEFLLLEDGREIIDGLSSWWTILHGHRQPVLMQALREASTRFDHFMFAGLTHEPAVVLAEDLLTSLRMPGGRVFYSDNGSTAVEVALKMAFQYWQRRGQERHRYIGFEGGYHGDTFGAMAVSRDPVFFGRFEPLLFAADIVAVDPNALAEKLSDDVAAVIIEPLVQGAGGMLMHSPETLAAIAAVCAAQGVPLIVDEVMTGGYRVGPRWAHQRCAFTPDIVCAGKTLTGGTMPLAATIASARIVEAFDTPDTSQTLFHGHSFTAHPLAVAVAVANVAIPAADKLARIEHFWRTRFAQRDVRITGSIVAMDVGASGGYLATVARAMRHAALDAGVLLRPLGNVLYAMPPLDTSDTSLERIAQALEAALAAAAR